MSKPKYSVKSNSLIQKTSPLITIKEAIIPKVFYSPKAYHKIKHIISICTKEVGWFGLVKQMKHDYLIEDIFVPEQEVTSTEADITAKAMTDLILTLDEPEKLLYWGHSHVNMGVSPSQQDELQVSEYLEHVDYFIRGIYNKKGESKVDVYNLEANLIHEAVENTPLILGMSEKELKVFETEAKANITEYKYTYSGQTFHQHSFGGGSSQQKSPANSRSKINPFVLINKLKGK